MNSPELDRINASQAQRLKESACRRAVAQTAGVGSLSSHLAFIPEFTGRGENARSNQEERAIHHKHTTDKEKA